MASVNKVETRIVDIDDDSDCSENKRHHRHHHRDDKHHHHNRHHHDQHHHNHHHHHEHGDNGKKSPCIKHITVYSVEENRMKTRKVKNVVYDNPWCCRILE
ncbi:uncharacterized histidine-rich protein DDB_G0274557-like [Harmonia axyridis]|uniref:uncharacterized histidine-rich protein DDB_G0274557-like n=1 Tax=Harmonia axyridis TaxID=115357 RepID=UPI001E2760AB|nr:uncharacterized histidine-rich protein DDB_G0274557-like [Harmonia axyridis]